jgi:hypothetical protein
LPALELIAEAELLATQRDKASASPRTSATSGIRPHAP